MPRRALSALRRLTGWVADVYLVSDADWRALIANYGADVKEGAPRRPLMAFTQTADMGDAAASIAAAATRGGGTTVTDARWEAFTWIRVQGVGRVDDVVLARPVHANPVEEEPCLAPNTSH